MKQIDASADQIRLSGFLTKAGPLLVLLGLLLLGISVALVDGSWSVFWKAYLVGWMATVGLALGALFFVVATHYSFWVECYSSETGRRDCKKLVLVMDAFCSNTHHGIARRRFTALPVGRCKFNGT